MVDKQQELAAIVVAVTERFIREDAPSTVKDISALTGFTERRVRALLTHEDPLELNVGSEIRESDGGAYSNLTGPRYHRVSVWRPTRRHLADLLKAASIEKEQA